MKFNLKLISAHLFCRWCLPHCLPMCIKHGSKIVWLFAEPRAVTIQDSLPNLIYLCNIVKFPSSITSISVVKSLKKNYTEPEYNCNKICSGQKWFCEIEFKVSFGGPSCLSWAPDVLTAHGCCYRGKWLHYECGLRGNATLCCRIGMHYVSEKKWSLKSMAWCKILLLLEH